MITYHTKIDYEDDRYLDRQVKLEINMPKIEYEKAIGKYEDGKYKHTDFENRPSRDDIAEDMFKTVAWEREETIEEGMSGDDIYVVFYNDKDAFEEETIIIFEYFVESISKTDLVVSLYLV